MYCVYVCTPIVGGEGRSLITLSHSWKNNISSHEPLLTHPSFLCCDSSSSSPSSSLNLSQSNLDLSCRQSSILQISHTELYTAVSYQSTHFGPLTQWLQNWAQTRLLIPKRDIRLWIMKKHTKSKSSKLLFSYSIGPCITTCKYTCTCTWATCTCTYMYM